MCLFCIYFVCILLLCTFATFGKVLDRKGNRRGIECSHFTKLPIYYRSYSESIQRTSITQDWQMKKRGNERWEESGMHHSWEQCEQSLFPYYICGARIPYCWYLGWCGKAVLLCFVFRFDSGKGICGVLFGMILPRARCKQKKKQARGECCLLIFPLMQKEL